jgi:TIR domain
VNNENDVFISYARRDRARVDVLWERLTEQHWTVWRDDRIPNAVPWEQEVLGNLERARSVLVVWSQSSIVSEWVVREATVARDRGTLLQAFIEPCTLPPGFSDLQAQNLIGWDGQIEHDEFKKLLRDAAVKIGPKKPVGTLPSPAPYELVSDKHVAMVHSCWRRADLDAQFGGQAMFQIHVILVGQQKVLDQVASVIYYFDPSYPQSTHVSTDRTKNFGIYELANGYSMMRASVKIKNQKDIVELSRFINLSKTGPRLARQFIGTDTTYRWHDED